MFNTIRLGCFILVLNVLFPGCLFADEAEASNRVDSLARVLEQTKVPQRRIVLLKQLVDLCWQSPEETAYLNEIIRLATPLDSIQIVYDAMADLSRYYYNVDKRDSLLYWQKQIETISQKKGGYPDALFMAGNLACMSYLYAQEYEFAMNESIRLLNLAQKVQQEYGLMLANQMQGLIYQAINRDTDALAAFNEGLVLMRKMMNNPALEMQYLSDVITSALRLDHFDETEGMLTRYSALLDSLKVQANMTSRIYLIKIHTLFLNAYLTEYYTRQGLLDKAATYQRALRIDSEERLDDDIRYPCLRASALYYARRGDNKRALEVLDKALLIERNLDILKMKVDVLRANGQEREALLLYDEALAKIKQIKDEAFDRQINQLRTLNNLNGNEKVARDLQYKKEQIRMKQNQLIGTLVVLLLLTVLLYALFRFYRHARLLKNDLQREKESLLASEKQLIIAKEEAVKANEMKTAFLSNISHEIHTPLNGIVGFSELLVEDVSEEDKVTFADTINANSELLLSLVNNVLELSRLESGNVDYSVRSCDLVECCRRAISDVQHRVAAGVELTFTPPVDQFLFKSDPLRLQQMLGNLLSNAAKFTRQGEINLTFSIDEANRQVYLSVTDTGCGIPLDKQTKIFERFEKLDEFVKGTGLGLSICQIVATGLGGAVWVDPAYTAGARFVFSHPYEITP